MENYSHSPVFRTPSFFLADLPRNLSMNCADQERYSSILD